MSQVGHSSLYIKRENDRRLKAFPAHNALTLSAGASGALFAVILFSAFDFKNGAVDSSMLLLSLTFLAPALISLMLVFRIRTEILKDGEVKKKTRYLGFLLVPFILVFNIFAASAGFTLIKKEKSVEYMLCAYAMLTTVIVIVLSCVNLFKPQVTENFYTGIFLLIGLVVFYIIVMLLLNIWTKGKTFDVKMVPFAILLIASSATGNIFAFILGLIILSKIKNKGKAVEWIDIVRRIFRNNMSVIGMFVVTFLLTVSICSIFTFDYSIAIDNSYRTILKAPSAEFPFGTDEFGRCVFTRIVFGARISLIVGAISTGIPIIIGGLLGAIAGHYGNRSDNIIMRILDIIYAVPGILLAIAIIAAFGANTMNLILALSIGSIPMYARTMRATVLSVSNNEFVEAAKACGQRNYQIILKHIIPNSMAPMIVRATLGIGAAVLATSSLSFLGLGVEPHIPEWGNILKSGSKYLETNPYLAVFPGIAIVLIVLAFNYFGDGLRDALDPKLK